MTEKPPKSPTGPIPSDRQDRQDRLKAALRANLQRRKVQARKRKAKDEN